MPDTLRTELKLPADARLGRLVQDYVRGLGELAGLPAEEVQSLTQGLWEACSDCLAGDFDDEDAGTYTLAGELTPSTLTLSLRLKQQLLFDFVRKIAYLEYILARINRLQKTISAWHRQRLPVLPFLQALVWRRSNLLAGGARV